ncbi:hypothetical protein L3Q82_006282 [Scortum barcoo]|uniref:Uncharacterized protein n=1 Tax=Scortum barcoo TaxID=214431 RepID=A0ACB8X2Y5_9TELE|nr:hypothetical protein L3Q82_006282 [Scortum barcoo]
MDPADQDQEPGPAQVRAAVTQQGILLGQHDANIRALTPVSPPEPEAETPRDIHSAPPESFSGQPHLCRGFLFHCSLQFQLRPARLLYHRHRQDPLHSGSAPGEGAHSHLGGSQVRPRNAGGGVLPSSTISSRSSSGSTLDSRPAVVSNVLDPVSSPPLQPPAQPLRASSDPSANASRAVPGDEPMHVGRARLTPEERSRRIRAGFPWLATHNPHLDWAWGKTFGLDWSIRCHETCLRSALSPATESAGPCGSSVPVDLSGVPEEYHDLKEKHSFLHYNYISRCNLIFQIHFMSYQKDFSQFICPSNCFSSFIGSFIALCDS